jgi:hypothetical protein
MESVGEEENQGFTAINDSEGRSTPDPSSRRSKSLKVRDTVKDKNSSSDRIFSNLKRIMRMRMIPLS